MPRRSNTRSTGFALILALLALVLLTTMGLALSNSTGVELQISTNHRWSESARYNAEAGIEYGQEHAHGRCPHWTAFSRRPVRPTRAGPWDGAERERSLPARVPAGNRATRNFENWKCDERGYGMGYGVVIDDGRARGPEEYRSEIGGATLNGAFTLWVRRPVAWVEVGRGTNGRRDVAPGLPTTLTIRTTSSSLFPRASRPTSAPPTNTSGFAATNRAVYTIETAAQPVGHRPFSTSPRAPADRARRAARRPAATHRAVFP